MSTQTRLCCDLSIEVLSQALEAIEHAILISDYVGTIVYVNPAFTRISGYSKEELLGQPCKIFQSGQTAAPIYQSLWDTLNKGLTWEGNLLNRRKSGEVYWQHLSISPLKRSNQAPYFVASVSDLSAQSTTQQRIDWLSAFDPLTSLPNRAQFISRLKTMLQEVAGSNETLTIIHLDIDNFGAINEKYGEQTGDLVLKKLAELLKKHVRQGDVLARLSSDEYGLILRNSQLNTQRPEIAQRFLDSAELPGNTANIESNVTFSMGIALFPSDGNDADALMYAAASAKQAAMLEGGNRFLFFRGDAGLSRSERLDLINQLRHGIANNELVLHYQPQVSLISGQVIAFEALVRWNHPERGLVPPVQFIPLAEETGLIIPLSEWVLKTACQQMHEWVKKTIAPQRIAVNMSAQHFHMSTLPNTVALLLAQYDLAPHQLELELTESMMMRDTATAITIIDQVKNLGIQLSLDDFGTGYSSLAYLSRLSIDALKIDQSFVADITSNPINASIVLATIAMAHKLGMRVIAEGVETEAQRIFLQRHGCDEMQGYGFSRPIPAADASRMLASGVRMSLHHTQEETADKPTLMLLDDEPNIINALRRVFRNEGYRILTANHAHEALELLAINRVDLILSDQRMPDMTGIEFLSRVKELYPNIVRVVLSGYSEIHTVTEAINKGAIYKYFTKPWDDAQLREEVRRIFRDFRA